MKLFADASVDLRIVRRLRALGHDVTDLIATDATLSDKDVLARAFDAGALLLTEDKDFGDLVLRHRMPTCGVVLIRLRIAESADIAPVTDRIDAALSEARGAFISLTPKRKRLRPL